MTSFAQSGHSAHLVPLAPIPGSPFVSVLIASYNYERFIRAAIDSVLRQSYRNFEVIVCDDGSNDLSPSILESYQDQRMSIIKKANGGQASALNRAFALSRGTIICILDADDAFEPEKIKKVVGAFKDASATGFVIHDLKIVDEHGHMIRIDRFTLSGYLGAEIPTLRMGLPIPQASGLSFRREVLERIMPLPEETFRTVADWAIGYHAAFITETAVIPEPLAQYRIHSSNLSGTTKTSNRLDLHSVEKTLIGIEKVLTYVQTTLLTQWNLSIQTVRARNYIEHKLLYAILSEDPMLRRVGMRELMSAFDSARRDYPMSRFVFWRLLGSLPIRLSHRILVLSFCVYKVLRKSGSAS